jgi:peptide deformylase
MSVDPAMLRIVLYPDPVLHRRAEPVETVDETVRAVAENMIALMFEADGVGLAAPQVGLSWRMFVARAIDDDDEPNVFINPVLELHRSEPIIREEGCLSLPNITADIRRPEVVTITALGLDGRPFTLENEGFVARVWQHEFDHLEGVLITDRMSPIDRLATRKALKAMESR